MYNRSSCIPDRVGFFYVLKKRSTWAITSCPSGYCKDTRRRLLFSYESSPYSTLHPILVDIIQLIVIAVFYVYMNIKRKNVFNKEV